MNTLPSNRRIRLPLLFILCLSIVGGILAFVLITSPVSAAIFGTPTPATSQEIVWAYASVPKPTYTPISVPVSVPTAMPTVTAISGSMVMEIVNGNQPSNVNQGQAPAFAYNGSKYILVDISEQHMYVYEADALIYSFVASTGINNATRVRNLPGAKQISQVPMVPHGIYGCQAGWESTILAAWKMAFTPCPFCQMEQPCGRVFWAGRSLTVAWYLALYEAQLLYDWAELGTPVEIRW